MARKIANKGFTLVEIAFVLVIIGLMISAGAELLPMLVKQSKFKQNQIIVNDAKAALIGYAMATGKLPYAAGGINGVATNGRYRGYLPWATLGISGRDAYMNILFYAVDRRLTTTTPATLKTPTLDNLISGTWASTLTCNGVTQKEAFVVLSGGENRRSDSPNDDNNNRIIDAGDNTQFADPTAVPIPTYDDILVAEPLTVLRGILP